MTFQRQLAVAWIWIPSHHSRSGGAAAAGGRGGGLPVAETSGMVAVALPWHLDVMVSQQVLQACPCYSHPIPCPHSHCSALFGYGSWQVLLTREHSCPQWRPSSAGHIKQEFCGAYLDSLINVDVKILSRLLAAGLQDVITKSIHID